jgi:hypothetical protein
MQDDGSVSLPGLDAMYTGPGPDAPSDQLRWGVKAHIERPDSLPASARDPHLPFDWEGIYHRESARMEQLAKPAK